MAEASVWKHVRTFIEAYGADLFHAKLADFGKCPHDPDAGLRGFSIISTDTSASCIR